MAQAETETFEVTYPRHLIRVLQFPPVFLLITALTGVSIAFCPFFLFTFGRWGDPYTSWRVILCFAVSYLVPSVYVWLGGRVLAELWKRKAVR